jgi:hypothetical protein
MPKSRRYRNRSRGGGGGLLSRFFGSTHTGEQSTTSTGPSTESSVNSTNSIADSTQAANQAVIDAYEKAKKVLQNGIANINDMIKSVDSNPQLPQQNPPVIGGMPGFANEYGLVQGGRLSSRKSRRRRRR